MRQAKEPFQFVTASYLIRVCQERARSLGDLARGLRTCSDGSIFYHTFQSLELHHYTAFSSDFAQWVMAACNEASLAERMAAVGWTECVSLEAVREALASAVEAHIREHPSAAERPGFETFHFCETVEVTVPQGDSANNLGELIDGIRRSSLQTLHHHFINSRLRLHLVTNDFSYWIHHSLGLPDLAQALNRVDVYTNTLEGLRRDLVETLQKWVER